MINKKTPFDQIVFVAFDTETTGLGKKSRLVEIGGLKFQNRKLQDTFPSILMDPEISIPPAVSKIHHITDQMVQGQERANTVLPKFLEFSKNSVFLAHNAPFDLRILESELNRVQIKIPPFPFLDTCGLSRKWFPHLKNHRLETLAEHFKIKQDAAHRAYEDAKTAMEIFDKIILQILATRKKITLGDLITHKGGLYWKGC